MWGEVDANYHETNDGAFILCGSINLQGQVDLVSINLEE